MLVEIFREEGLRGWLAGIVPALVLVLNPAIQFALYDHLRLKVLQLKQVGFKPPLTNTKTENGQCSVSGCLNTFQMSVFACVLLLEMAHELTSVLVKFTQ